MVGGFSNEDRIWRIEESVKVLCELVLIEILKAFVIVLAVAGESVNGDLCCFVAWVTLVHKVDGVLER